MSKTVRKVFIIVGVLVLCLLVWVLFLGENGIVVTAYNGIADGVNGVWKNISGQDKELIPTWEKGTGNNNTGANVNLKDGKEHYGAGK